MGFIGFKPCKLNYTWQSCEESVSANRIVDIFLSKWVRLVRLRLCYNTPLQLNLVHITWRFNALLVVSLDYSHVVEGLAHALLEVAII